MAAIAGLRGGQLRMASFPTAGATLMPLAIAIFRAQHPEVDADARRGRARGDRPAAVGRRVRHRAAVRVRGDERVARARTSAASPLFEDPMFLALPADHPLARRRDAAAREPARRGVDPDVGVEPVRAPRRALVPRRRLRADRVLRERRLPDRPGAGRRRRRRRADPQARARRARATTSRSARCRRSSPVREVIAATPAGHAPDARPRPRCARSSATSRGASSAPRSSRAARRRRRSSAAAKARHGALGRFGHGGLAAPAKRQGTSEGPVRRRARGAPWRRRRARRAGSGCRWRRRRTR